MKKTISLLIVLILTAGGCTWSRKIENFENENSSLRDEIKKQKEENKKLLPSALSLNEAASRMKAMEADIKTTAGTITVSFFPEKAPLTCLSFLARAESGFYEGTVFHRVIPGFMIQGGDPNSKDNNPANDGLGGPAFSIPHEFNNISHARGILSMARPADKKAGAGSQFFIMHANSTHLDGQYTAFGKVMSGMDVADKIANSPTGRANRPEEPPVIEEIIVRKNN
ncbi:MAG: peptidylprolyl isomerase [Fibrobacterota bacterium]